MKNKACKVISGIIVMTAFCAVSGFPQTERGQAGQARGCESVRRDMSRIELSGKPNEPHHILATAYLQSMATFGKALMTQAQATSQLSTDFARAAVEEIRRTFDAADEQRRAAMKTIGEEPAYNAMAMMKDPDPVWSGLKDVVKALENDVQGYTLNDTQIATDSADLLKRLDDMSSIKRPRE